MTFGPARWAVVAGVLLAACGSNTASSPETVVSHAEPGSRGKGLAPGFSLLDVNGRTRSLAEFKGRVVFLDFWASWCPPCRVSMPEVEKLHADYADRPLQVIGMNLDDDLDAARRFADRKGIPYPVLLAGGSDAAGAYGVGGIPHFVLIDQEGRLIRMWTGFSPEMGKEWRSAIDKLLGA